MTSKVGGAGHRLCVEQTIRKCGEGGVIECAVQISEGGWGCVACNHQKVGGASNSVGCTGDI